MHHQKNYNMYSFEAQEEKNRRSNNSIISQLTTFTFNMLSFELDPRSVKDILINFGKYYDIGDDKIEDLMKNLNEYVQLNNRKNSVENIEVNKEETLTNVKDNKQEIVETSNENKN